MSSCTINFKEYRYVIVTEVQGSFLHANMEGTLHMLLEGEIAELIVRLDPKIYIITYGTI